MKKAVIALNLILLLSFVGFGQKQKKSPVGDDAQSETSRQSNRASKSVSNGNVLLQSGASLEGELQNTLDVKKAAVGDQVVLKVTKSIKQNGEVIVPKGARLLGRVTEVQEKTKNNAMSKIGIVFEQIQGNNLNAPLNASIVTILRATSNAGSGSGLLDADVSGTANSTGRVSGGSGGSGGGLLGGIGSAVGGTLNTATSVAGNTVGTVTNTAGNTLGSTVNSVGTTIGGIRISQSADVSAQGASTLSAQGKNVRLEKGTVLGLRLNQSIEN